MRRVFKVYTDPSVCVFMILLLLITTVGSILAEDADPHCTGLIPLTEEEERAMFQKRGLRIKEVALNELGLSRMGQVKRGPQTRALAEKIALPSSVDNSTLKYFPPIRTQGGLNSCVPFSITYYQLTYYFSKKYDWDQKNDDNSIKFSPKWIYNFINNGNNGGTSWYTAYNTILQHGCATWEEFPYEGSSFPETNFREWSDDPAVWRNALNYRVERYLPYVDNDDFNTDEFLRIVKELLVNGEILIFQAFVNSWNYSPILDNPATTNDDPEIGKNCCFYSNGYEGSHSMTIVGYNDDIWVDLNENGQLDPGETGALRIANSWGDSWQDNGFTWVSYDAIKERSVVLNGPNPDTRNRAISGNVWFIRPKQNVEPRILAEMTLNHRFRDEIDLGIDVDGSSIESNWYTHIFYSGPFAFDGTETARPYTFVFDISSLIEDNFLDNSEPRNWILRLSERGPEDALTIDNFKITDVQGGSIEKTAGGLPQTYADEERTFAINHQLGASVTNYPPIVDAGDFRSVNYPETEVDLTGNVMDDGLPLGSSVTTTWSLIYGPGDAVIADPTALTTTATLSFEGDYLFRLTASDGDKEEYKDVFVYYSRDDGTLTIFRDNFDTDMGWISDPGGTDNATAGLWERAEPEATSYSGTAYQLSTVVNGTHDLSTGPLAGSSVGTHDIDNGVTSIRSPLISLPVSTELILSLSYYFSHYSNSSVDDYLRVKVVGSTTETILEQLGEPSVKGAQWIRFEHDLDGFAGQDVYILIEAADAGGGSLVEAGIDNVVIKLSENEPCNDPCSIPAGLYADNITDRTADLHWGPVVEAHSYIVQYQYNEGFYWITWCQTPNTETTLFNLVSGSQYNFRVKSVCSDECESAYADSVVFETPSCPIPTNVHSTAIGQSTATIAWNAMPEALEYQYLYWPSNQGMPEEWYTVTENSVSLSGLASGTEYIFTVKAVYPQCVSYHSNYFYFTTEGGNECSTPQNLVASSITQTSADVAWDPVIEASNYEYQYREIEGLWSGWAKTGSINWVPLTGLTPGTDYEFMVRTNCVFGDSDPSYIYTFRTLSTGIAPEITEHPSDMTINVGEAATVCVTATGTVPLTYQWYKNGAPVPNSNGSCYTPIESATMADNGTLCYVVVSNEAGSVTSATATITVNPVSIDIINEDFNVDAGNFSYADDLFRNTTQPDYASGAHDLAGGCSGTGGVTVELGGINGDDIDNMSGGWQVYFYLSEAQIVTVSMRYILTISSEYESNEFSEVLISMDGVLHGSGTDDYVARLVGDGNGGSDQSTGWQTFTKNLGSLAAGSHWLYIGGFNNRKTYSNENSNLAFDDVVVTGEASGVAPVITEHPHDLTVGEGAPATFCVSATGTAPLSYEWYRDAQLIPGATSSCYTLPSVTSSDDGALFYAIVSNDYGSTVAATAVLTVTTPITLIDENFDTQTGKFEYYDDLFNGTSQPAYADGIHITSGGFSGGAVTVDLGGINDDDIVNMSGGWQGEISLDQTSQVTITFRYKLTQTADYESDEYSDILLTIDEVFYGTGGNDYLARITGDGNGGGEKSTGWQYIELNCGSFEPGFHTINIGGFNNKKTYSNESTEVLIDDVTVTALGE